MLDFVFFKRSVKLDFSEMVFVSFKHFSEEFQKIMFGN